MSSYTIPYVIERTPAGERSFDIYSRLLQERIIFVGTEIDDGVANVVMAQLLHLADVAPDREVVALRQQPGRLVHGAHGRLRHDAVRAGAGRDVLPRAGGVRRGGAPRGGGAGAALRPAALPGAAAPAVRRAGRGR